MYLCPVVGNNGTMILRTISLSPILFGQALWSQHHLRHCFIKNDIRIATRVYLSFCGFLLIVIGDCRCWLCSAVTFAAVFLCVLQSTSTLDSLSQLSISPMLRLLRGCFPLYAICSHDFRYRSLRSTHNVSGCGNRCSKRALTICFL